MSFKFGLVEWAFSVASQQDGEDEDSRSPLVPEARIFIQKAEGPGQLFGGAERIRCLVALLCLHILEF